MAKKLAKNLKKEWVVKFAGYKRYPTDMMLKLYDDGVLNFKGIRDYLILKDIDYVMKIAPIQRKEAIEVVAKEYEKSVAHVLSLTYEKPPTPNRNAEYPCESCGKFTSRYKKEKYNGLCDDCRQKEQANEDK